MVQGLRLNKVREQKSEARCQITEVREQKAENRGQKTEGREKQSGHPLTRKTAGLIEKRN
jgi:hypothetical protein